MTTPEPEVDLYDALASVGGGDGPRRPPPRVRIAKPVVGDEEVDAVRGVLTSGILTNGPRTRAFEAAMAELHQTEHAVAFANGTVALAAMYLAAGIGPGDEVIVPSLTFISTATSVLHVGATPVFADVDPVTCNLDPADVAKRITPRTRAVVPVHYGGQAADMPAFRALADDAGLMVLEDAAEAHGAVVAGKPVGGWGHAAMFSFTPTKNITTGEGGIVTTDDGDLAQSMRLLRNHGMTAQYRHDVLGFNWRITEMQAAMGVCQVERLPGILAAKRANAEILTARLAEIDGIHPPAEAPGCEHTYMLYTIQVDGQRRDAVRDGLEDDGIETRIYFPSAHRQRVFLDLGYDVHDLPVTEDLAGRILSLPCHSTLTSAELHEIADRVAVHVAT